MTGWAATNTLRKCISNPVVPNIYDADARAALALVETALDAAEGVMTQMDYETPHHSRLAAALRAVREGA